MLSLVLVLWIDELASQTIHYRHLSKLCPEEVDFLWIVLVLEEPPKAILEECADHHLIVAFTDVTFVVEPLEASVVDSPKILI